MVLLIHYSMRKGNNVFELDLDSSGGTHAPTLRLGKAGDRFRSGEQRIIGKLTWIRAGGPAPPLALKECGCPTPPRTRFLDYPLAFASPFS